MRTGEHRGQSADGLLGERRHLGREALGRLVGTAACVEVEVSVDERVVGHQVDRGVGW